MFIILLFMYLFIFSYVLSVIENNNNNIQTLKVSKIIKINLS